jgi:8-oxo-dGTP diphosphatase
MAGEQHFQIGVKGLIRNKKGEILMVRIPEWSGNPAHWDLPGGRMDPGESFLQTLKRELQEEIGVPYVGTPTQLVAVLTSITIPVGDTRVPLVFVIYEARIAPDAQIKLDPNSAEEDFQWFPPAAAADNMGMKFSAEFCHLVRSL